MAAKARSARGTAARNADDPECGIFPAKYAGASLYPTFGGPALLIRFKIDGGAKDGAEITFYLNLSAEGLLTGHCQQQLAQFGVQNFDDLKAPPGPPAGAVFGIDVVRARASGRLYAKRYEMILMNPRED